MASAVYPLAKEAFLSGDIDLTADDIKFAFLTSAYSYSGTDQFYDDLSGVVAASTNLASKTVANGVFDAADHLVSSVTGGSTIVAIALYKDTGSTSTSPLICFIDGLSQATNGDDILVTWDSGASKIFTL